MSTSTPPDDDFVRLAEQYRQAVETGDYCSVDGLLQDILASADEWCAQIEQTPALELTEFADECEEHADWPGAESAYRKILAVPELDALDEYSARKNLVSLYRLLDRDRDALHEAELAVADARESEATILLAVALESHARSLLKVGLLTEAEAQLDEALTLVDGDPMANQIKARLQTERARCSLARGEDDLAQEHLEAAYALLEPQLGMCLAAGVQGDLQHWWLAKAALHTARKQSDEAVAAWEEAVILAGHIASLPHCQSIHCDKALADTLFGFASALEADGRQAEANSCLSERDVLLTRIGLPTE